MILILEFWYSTLYITTINNQNNDERYFYGNITRDASIQVAERFAQRISNKPSLDLDTLPQMRLNRLFENRVYVYEFSLNNEDYNPEEPNSCLQTYF